MKKQKKRKQEKKAAKPNPLQRLCNSIVGFFMSSAVLFFVYCLMGVVLDIVFGIQLY